MKIVSCALLVMAAAWPAFPASAADGVAFITDLKGEVAVDGTPRPKLLSELAKGQKIRIGKDGQLFVMFIQSGKEYALGGPGDYTVGEREVAASSGMPPATRETAWRASPEVLVKVSQTASASIRMRSFAPVRPEAKAKQEFPTQGAVASLQPTLRWSGADAVEAEVVIFLAGREDKPLATAKATGGSHRFPFKLKPGADYVWSVSIAGRAIGPAHFRTLAAADLQTIEKRRPTEKAEFSDRLMFALLLQELGAVQEAQQAWGRLAQEREDLPELTGLAR